MAEKRKSDIVSEAVSKVEPELKKTNKKYFKVLNNALIISLVTIILLIIQYSYIQGYFSVYNIPSGAIRLDLKNCIPFAAYLCSDGLFIVMYITLWKRDNILHNRKFNFFRMIVGSMIIVIFLYYYFHFDSIWTRMLIYVFAVIISIFIELLRCYKYKHKKDKTIEKSSYKWELETTIYDYLYYSYTFKTGVGILVIAICTAPLLGAVSAKTNNEYQILTYENQSYAIIMDYRDDFLVQKASENKNVLTIHTDYYKYLPNDDLEITNKKYAKVIIEKQQENNNA